MTIEINIKGDNYVLLTPMNFVNAMVEQGLFKVDELEELAEYLLVFCKHNEDDRGGRYSLNDPDVINIMLDKKKEERESSVKTVKRFHSNSDIQED